MKSKIIKSLMVSLMFFGGFSGNENIKLSAETIDNTNTYTPNEQFIGYGYNVAAGKPIYQTDALMLNHPILDVDNEELLQKVKVFKSSQTTYVSQTSNKASEIAETYGMLISAGTGVEGKINCVNVGLDMMFNRNTNSSWAKTQKEEYSYYTIFSKAKPVVLQMDEEMIMDYLDPKFQSDLHSIQTESDAEKLFHTYGTHLLTGYTLGGIFEMTNYFATQSSAYQREVSQSFNVQVSVGMEGMVSGDIESSFGSEFSSKDNNQMAVNNYKCSTYGGYAFPGLTIEQAFSWYETLTDAGYVYDIWTDSINRGDNLVIVEIPQSSEMIPLWNLLPSTEKYNNIRKMLVEKYVEICGGAYKKYINKYPDVFATDNNFNSESKDEYPTVDVEGYQYYYPLEDGKYMTSYVNDVPDVASVAKDSIVALEFDASAFIGEEISWAPSAGDIGKIELLDPINGVFRVIGDSGTITLNFKVAGASIGISQKFKICSSINTFAGGAGTKESPYLISTKEQFNNIKYDLGKHYKLVTDIDFGFESIAVLAKTENTAFTGSIDGNYHSLLNVNINKSSNFDIGGAIGLIGHNKGTIKNLTIKTTSSADSSRIVNYDTTNINFNNAYGGNQEKFNSLTSQLTAAKIRKAQYVGAFVGKNYDEGVVENCHIDKVVVQNYLNDLITRESNEAKERYVGGIVGYNEGKVTYCSTKNSKVYNRGENYFYSYVGGIVGYHNSEEVINYCVSDNNLIYSRTGVKGVSKGETIACAAGIVGQLNKGTIQNCLVRNATDSAAKFNNNIISQAAGSDSNAELYSYSGGLFGKAEYSNEIKNCVVYNAYVIEAAKSVNSTTASNNNNFRNGIFGGYLTNYNSDASAEYFNDCFYQNNESLSTLFNGLTQLDTIKDSYKWDQIKGNGFDESYWEGSPSNLPCIKENCVSTNDTDLVMDIENTKTEMFVGSDVFLSGKVDIYGRNTIGGESFLINEYIIDVSAVNKDEEGSHQILISSYGKNFEYYVTYVEPKLVGINLEISEEVKTQYYVGEEFDPTGIVVKGVYEDGSVKVLQENEYEIISGKLVEGNNEIIISSNKLAQSFYVLAEKRAINRIEVNDKALQKRDYIVGIKSINTTGLEVTVYYEDGTVEKVDPSECDFIFSKISSGNNEIIVSYDAYYTDSFTVTGVYSSTGELINKFKENVLAIDTSSSITKQYVAINNALNALASLNNYTDEVVQESKELLNKKIEAYNEKINAINQDFIKQVATCSNVNETLLSNGGYYVHETLVSLTQKPFK